MTFQLTKSLRIFFKTVTNVKHMNICIKLGQYLKNVLHLLDLDSFVCLFFPFKYRISHMGVFIKCQFLFKDKNFFQKVDVIT